MTETEQRWIPLESNPKVINKYVHNLGMDCNWNFVDVYGLDPELLAMVPRPVAALVLLFPDTKQPLEMIGEVQKDFPTDLYYTKQTIGNACGTVAIVHALANNQNQIKFDDSKHFKTFLEMTSSMTPEERAKFLEQDNKMGAAHEDCAQEGDTQAPPVDEHVTSHFIALVHFNGCLYELDGRKDAPVVHGRTNPDTFLPFHPAWFAAVNLRPQFEYLGIRYLSDEDSSSSCAFSRTKDAAEVIRKFMAREPDNVNFNVMALVNCSDVD